MEMTMIRKTRLTLVALAAAATTPAAMAQAPAPASTGERPWYVGLTQEFAYLSNVLGAASGEVSDTVSTTSLRGGVNTRLGRQRLYANATLGYERYSDLSERNGNVYSIGAGIDWSTIERLSGSLSWNSQRRQAGFDVGGITTVPVSNRERSDDIAFRARLGVVTAVGIEAALGHRRVDFSAPQYAAREYKEDRADIGLVWRPSGITTLSAGVAGTKTRYRTAAPGQLTPDENERREAYVGATWVPTGASSVSARLAATQVEYEQATGSDFDGVTGSLTWAWRPTGRLAVTTTLSRDTGQESGFLRLVEGAPTIASDFSNVTNRASVSAAYELTGKISLTGGVAYARRFVVDSVAGTSGRDNTTGVSIGARWAATRTLAFGCSASRDTRSASGSASNDYDSDRVACFGSVTLD
jgi:Putative beta-barrel porin 2